MQVNVDGEVEQLAKRSNAWREEGKGRTTLDCNGKDCVMGDFENLDEERSGEREVMVAMRGDG